MPITADSGTSYDLSPVENHPLDYGLQTVLDLRSEAMKDPNRWGKELGEQRFRETEDYENNLTTSKKVISQEVSAEPTHDLTPIHDPNEPTVPVPKSLFDRAYSWLEERHKKDFGEDTTAKGVVSNILMGLNFIAPGKAQIPVPKEVDISHYELQPLAKTTIQGKSAYKETLLDNTEHTSLISEGSYTRIGKEANVEPGSYGGGQSPANQNIPKNIQDFEAGKTPWADADLNALSPEQQAEAVANARVMNARSGIRLNTVEGGGVKSPGGNPQPMQMQQHQSREEYMREYQKNYNRTDDRSLRYPIENSTNKWGVEGSRMGPGDNWQPNMNLINKVAEGLKQGLPHKEIAEQLGEGYTSKDISNVSYFMRNKLNMDVPKYNEVKSWTGTEVKALKEHYEQGGTWKDFQSERSVESIKKRASQEGLTKSNIWSEQETAALKDWFTKGNNPSLFPSDTRSIDALILKARQLGYQKGK